MGGHSDLSPTAVIAILVCCVLVAWALSKTWRLVLMIAAMGITLVACWIFLVVGVSALQYWAVGWRPWQ